MHKFSLHVSSLAIYLCCHMICEPAGIMGKHRPQLAAPYPKEPKPGPEFATGTAEQLDNF